MGEVDRLLAVSPIDGRYDDKTATLQDTASEYGLISRRLHVMSAWYELMISGVLPDVERVSNGARAELAGIWQKFQPEAAVEVKQIEKETNHDVKAVEVYLKRRISVNPELEKNKELIHFGCTSEDVNNMAYALMLKDARDLLQTHTSNIVEDLSSKAHAWADIPLLSHTHGQPATPSTLGKEMSVFEVRLEQHQDRLGELAIRGKWNGATGNYAAGSFAYPEVDWPQVSVDFVSSFGMTPTMHTTQIEPHDWMVSYFNEVAHGNSIKFNLARDAWAYISRGVFGQKVKKGEVGSSTMPHKVNPIDFENAEANYGLANAALGHLAAKLPVSRLQRDLSDSSALRAVGEAFGHTVVADKSTLRGLGKIIPNSEKIAEELDGNWAVLTEAIQTVMRRYQVEGAYDIIKQASRGEEFGKQEYEQLVENLDIPEDAKNNLRNLTPAKYIGRSIDIARGQLTY